MTENNWIERYIFRVSAVRAILLFLFHALVFTLCYTLAWLVRFEFTIPRVHEPAFHSSLPFVLGVQLVVGFLFGFYRGWWRYVGVGDVIRLALGLTTSLAILLAFWNLGTSTPFAARVQGVSRAAILIDWAFALLTLFGARVAMRITRDRTRFSPGARKSRRRVLIIGAGDAGESLARELEHRPQLGMKAVAFVDDHPGKWGSHIRGIPIHGPIGDMARIASEKDATEALIAMPSAPGARIREIIHDLAGARIGFRTIPGIDQLVSGKVRVTQLRPVNADDLLRREKIELPGNPVRTMFRGRAVMVTGAGGTIGSELASQIIQMEPSRIVLVERSEFALYQVRRRIETLVPADTVVSFHLADISDGEAVAGLLSETAPEIVLHAAAHKHVPLGEENPGEYLRNNALAALEFARSCADHSVARFVFISTDKAINPSSIMGASKRAAEILLIDLARRSSMSVSVVRFGNVIGSSGSAVPLFLEQIESGGPITITHPEVTRYFLRTSEAVSLVLQAATLGNDGRVFMLDMGEPVRIVDLARDLIRLSNRSESEIEIVFTGLRPGEKLFEEIRLQGESIHPTVHPRIVVTEAPQPDTTEVDQWLFRANRFRTLEPAGVRDLLGTLVPEYRAEPQNGATAERRTDGTGRSFSINPFLGERQPS